MSRSSRIQIDVEKDDPLSIISKIPILSREEQFHLAEAGLNGDVKARRKLIYHNLGLVVWHASWKIRTFRIQELLGAACIGLIKAADKFIPYQNYSFVSYASVYVRESLDSTLREIDSWEQLRESDWAERLLRARENPYSNLSDTYERQEIHRAIRRLVAELPKLYRVIIKHRFGFDGWEKRTIHSLSRVLRLPQERIRQYELDALNLLRHKCSDAKIYAFMG